MSNYTSTRLPSIRTLGLLDAGQWKPEMTPESTPASQYSWRPTSRRSSTSSTTSLLSSSTPPPSSIPLVGGFSLVPLAPNQQGADAYLIMSSNDQGKRKGQLVLRKSLSQIQCPKGARVHPYKILKTKTTGASRR